MHIANDLALGDFQGHRLRRKPLFFGLAVYILVMLVTPINAFLTERIFSGFPDWVFLDEATQYETYAKNILLVVFTLP